jgi:hypothetical protein
MNIDNLSWVNKDFLVVNLSLQERLFTLQ